MTVESRMSRPLYTVSTEISNTLCQVILSSARRGFRENVSFVTSLHVDIACSEWVIAYFI